MPKSVPDWSILVVLVAKFGSANESEFSFSPWTGSAIVINLVIMPQILDIAITINCKGSLGKFDPILLNGTKCLQKFDCRLTIFLH